MSCGSLSSLLHLWFSSHLLTHSHIITHCHTLIHTFSLTHSHSLSPHSLARSFSLRFSVSPWSLLLFHSSLRTVRTIFCVGFDFLCDKLCACNVWCGGTGGTGVFVCLCFVCIHAVDRLFLSLSHFDPSVQTIQSKWCSNSATN